MGPRTWHFHFEHYGWPLDEYTIYEAPNLEILKNKVMEGPLKLDISNSMDLLSI